MIKDKAIKYGSNVDTDVIIPARYLNTIDEKELAVHCFEDLDKDFSRKVNDSRIVIAAENFGCGSSREHAPLAIKASGVKLIIAKSYARIFFRNAINIGLPILESKEAAQKIKTGDVLEISLKEGKIKNLTRHQSYSSKPFPDFLLKIINSDGLINYIKNIPNSRDKKKGGVNVKKLQYCCYGR
ncbi:MAG TPA: 3-isopropylmalate dehydratase small subunit [Actinobacteria bacterium]|nr:3-isopropylmalate dehydratase small subunit [Actinomycetota bacterium]